MKKTLVTVLLLLSFGLGFISHDLVQRYRPKPFEKANIGNEDVEAIHLMEASNPNDQTRQSWKNAIEGDGQSAKEMSALFGKSFPNRGHFFERIGAENGNAVSQYNYGIRLISASTSPLVKARGIYWLKKSAAQGDVDAREYLKTLNEDRGGL